MRVKSERELIQFQKMKPFFISYDANMYARTFLMLHALIDLRSMSDFYQNFVKGKEN